MDEATLRRVMNGLRARGAFDLPTEPPQAPAALADLRLHPWRVACRRSLAWCVQHVTPATLAAALLAAAWLVAMPPPEATVGAPQMAGQAQPAPPQWHGPPDATVVQFIPTAQPQQDALRLMSTLAAQGVAAELRPVTQDRVVQAILPPENRQAIAQALAQEGLVAPSSGPLVVHFVAPAG